MEFGEKGDQVGRGEIVFDEGECMVWEVWEAVQEEMDDGLAGEGS